MYSQKYPWGGGSILGPTRSFCAEVPGRARFGATAVGSQAWCLVLASERRGLFPNNKKVVGCTLHVRVGWGWVGLPVPPCRIPTPVIAYGRVKSQDTGADTTLQNAEFTEWN